MIRRDEVRAIARAAVATIVAAFVAAAVIGSGLSRDALDAGDPDAALRLNPLSAEARSTKAAYLLGESEYAQAEKLAAASIDRSPLNAEAAAILGYISGLRAKPARAHELMAIAAAMSWDSEPAQLWMLRAETAAFNFNQAVLRTDALLRQRLRREELFIFLRGLAAYPDALGPLAHRLALRPKWRWDYLEALAGLSPGGFAAHEALLTALKRTPAPPTADEINAYISRLVSEGLYRQARDAGIRLAGRSGNAELVNDPQFRRLNPPGQGSPFEWAKTKIPGVSLQLESSGRTGNVSALRVTAEGRPAGPALEQIIVLPPGSYLLVTASKEAEQGSLKSIHWQLTCLGGNGALPVLSRPPSQLADGWRRLEKMVTIPSSACPAQRLELRLDHDEGRDLDAWIRSVDIRRTDS
jgi:tetratricopeptide (TPR) repeat protein